MFEGFARSRSITRKHAYVKHAWFQLLSVFYCITPYISLLHLAVVYSTTWLYKLCVEA